MEPNKNGWIAECIEELKLPGSPWYKVHDLVAERLAYRIKIEGLTYDQLARVSKFVGKDFIKHHKLYESLSHGTSSNTTSTRLSTDEEVQKFLKDLTLKATKDAECSLPEDSNSDQSFVKTVNLIKSIHQSRMEKMDWSYGSSAENSSVNKADMLAATIIEILQSDPGKVTEVISRMKGRYLPTGLRKYLYKLILLKKRKKSPEASQQRHFGAAFANDVELNQKQIRENFAANVKSGMHELKIKNPTETHLYHLIRSSVVEAFNSNVGLRSYAESIALQQESSRVLNIFYTYKKKFEFVNALWLLPLQIAFEKDTSLKENDYELALWLDLLITEVVLPWPLINQVVFSAWFNALQFSQNSSAFHDVNLVKILISMDVPTEQDTVKSLLQNGDHPKYHRSAVSENTSSSKQVHPSLGTDVAPHPVLLMRQWVVQLFVGSTSVPTTMFIWDQLFLNGWSRQCFKRVCLVLIYCLASNIGLCKNKDDLLELFSKKVSSIHLREITLAWKKLNDLFPL